MKNLQDLLKKVESGDHQAYLELSAELKKYSMLLEDAKYLCYIGTPTKSSRDFDRAVKRGLDRLGSSVLHIEQNIDTRITNEEQKKEDLKIVKKVGIRPVWISGYN